MKTMWAASRTVAVLVSALLLPGLSGCGTSPPVRYFNLNPIGAFPTEGSEDHAIIGLGPLDLPAYISRPQIVLRRPDGEVIISDYRRWAEPLDDAIHRIVATNVDGIVDDVTVVWYPYNTLLALDYRIYGDIVRFDADATGKAVLLIQWGMVTSDREVVVAPRRDRYEASVSGDGDTGAIVAAMNEVVSEFSRDVADEVSKVVGD